MEEAIKIGTLFRKYLLKAEAPNPGFKLEAPAARAPEASQEDLPPPGFEWVETICEGTDCICASACALIWFGAPERSGTVGLHRPYTEDPAFRAMTPAEASTAYDQLLDRVTQYLEQMEVPHSVIESMTSTGSSELTWVTDTDGTDKAFPVVSKFGPPSFTEWKDASCGHLSAQEYQALYSLEVNLFSKGLKGTEQFSEVEQSTRKLEQKWASKKRCEADLIAMNRAKLPVP